MPGFSTLGFIGGTGPQGRGLGIRFALAGHPVLLGSRDAERGAAVAEELRAGRDLPIRGVPNDEAAVGGDLVFLVMPWEGHAGLVASLAAELAGKVVVDVVNPLAFDQRGPHVLGVEQGSAAAQAQALVPSARVVAAFHHASAPLLLDAGHELDEDVLVCGDDAAAKEQVIALADELPGVRGVDAGPLRLAREVEAMTAVLLSVNRRYKVRAGLRVTGLPEAKRRPSSQERA